MMMTLNGMFSEPKPHRINFIKENKRKLKQISSLVQQNIKYTKVDLAKSQSSQTDICRPIQGSSTRINPNQNSACKLNKKSTITVFMRDKRKDEVGSTTQLFTPKISSHRSVNLSRNQSTQTIDPKNYDQLFHEGTILYPSTKVLDEIAETEKQKLNRLDAHVKKDFFRKNRIKSKSPPKVAPKTSTTECKKEVVEVAVAKSDEENKAPEEPIVTKTKESETKVAKQKTKEAGLNAAEIIRKTTEDHLNYSPRSNLQNQTISHPSNRGDSITTHVSKMLRKPASKKIKKEDDEVLKAVLDPMCPPGHIPLPDQERKKTLHMLRVSYAELIREMNLLPVRTDTLRIRQRKIQLENQLNKIEEGIKVFNKSKVYVKIEV